MSATAESLLVVAIVAAAAAWLLISVYRMFSSPQAGRSACGGCTGCRGSDAAAQRLFQIDRRSGRPTDDGAR